MKILEKYNFYNIKKQKIKFSKSLIIWVFFLFIGIVVPSIVAIKNESQKEEASKLIVQEFEERLKQVITHKDLNRKISYQYLVRLECYKLIKHLLGEKKYQAFQMWW